MFIRILPRGQGSILGPLLFLLYINDMPQAVTCDLLLYADNTCLVFQHKDLIEIETALNKISIHYVIGLLTIN